MDTPFIEIGCALVWSSEIMVLTATLYLQYMKSCKFSKLLEFNFLMFDKTEIIWYL